MPKTLLDSLEDMMQWREGVVQRERSRWPGAIEYSVTIPGGDEFAAEIAALAYTDVVGEAKIGDRVLLGASALLKGLGTGGMAFVVANLDRSPADPVQVIGHIMKARYTPLQQMFLAVDEQDSPHHHLLEQAESLGGMPVVAADLHSALPAVIAGIRTVAAQARVIYVMSDAGALPMAFSRAVAGLMQAGWLAGTITVGQAYGGAREAVSVHSGLLAARLVDQADIAVVIQGPGNVGTGTTWGFSGVSVVESLHAAAALDGVPIAALRVSRGDGRARHQGISHHSRTAYGKALFAPALMPVPLPGADDELGQQVHTQARDLVRTARSDLTLVEVDSAGLLEALRDSPVRLSTMGRGLAEDPDAFIASAVAGVVAADRLT